MHYSTVLNKIEAAKNSQIWGSNANNEMCYSYPLASGRSISWATWVIIALHVLAGSHCEVVINRERHVNQACHRESWWCLPAFYHFKTPGQNYQYIMIASYNTLAPRKGDIKFHFLIFNLQT